LGATLRAVEDFMPSCAATGSDRAAAVPAQAAIKPQRNDLENAVIRSPFVQAPSALAWWEFNQCGCPGGIGELRLDSVAAP